MHTLPVKFSTMTTLRAAAVGVSRRRADHASHPAHVLPLVRPATSQSPAAVAAGEAVALSIVGLAFFLAEASPLHSTRQHLRFRV